MENEPADPLPLNTPVSPLAFAGDSARTAGEITEPASGSAELPLSQSTPESPGPDQAPVPSDIEYPAPRSFFGITPPALVLFLFSIGLFVYTGYLGSIHRERLESIRTSLPKGMSIDLVKQQEALLKNPGTLVLLLLMVGCVLGGAIVFVGLLIVYFVASKSIRAALRDFFCKMAARPRAVLGLFDTLAILCAMMSVTAYLSTRVSISVDMPSIGLRAGVMHLCMDFGWVFAVVAALLLAHWKAGGPRGWRAFWPPWNSEGVRPERPLWMDIALGMAAYPATLWVTTLLNLINQRIAPPDHHQIIDILSSQPRPFELAMIFAAATLSAPFFEEIMFRGILYNALRGMFRPLVAAVLAASVFALVHFVWSQFLGLMALGLIMTWLYAKTGRLAASMTFHFTNNFASMVMLIVQLMK